MKEQFLCADGRLKVTDKEYAFQFGNQITDKMAVIVNLVMSTEENKSIGMTVHVWMILSRNFGRLHQDAYEQFCN